MLKASKCASLHIIPGSLLYPWGSQGWVGEPEHIQKLMLLISAPACAIYRVSDQPELLNETFSPKTKVDINMHT